MSRGRCSSDIRAPNFRELFYSQTIPAGGFFGTVANPWIIPPPFGNNQDPTQWALVGNTELDPEKAKTTTVGLVIQPTGTGLQFSADRDQLLFVGDLVSFFTETVRVGRTSITVKVLVEAERWGGGHGERVKVTEAEVVLVAVDEAGRPAPILPQGATVA